MIKHLIFKSYGLLLLFLLEPSTTQRERKESYLVVLVKKKNEMKCVVIDIYISHKDKIHNLWK
jgi:hypothetical protein